MHKLIKILSAAMMLASMQAIAGTKQKHLDFSPFIDIQSQQIADLTQKTNFRHSSSGITDPIERETMRLMMRNNPTGNYSINTPLREGEKLYTVKCILPGEDMPYFAIYNQSFFSESNMETWFETGETDVYYFQVPEGTYDVNVQYYSTIPDMTGDAFLVHEGIFVNADTEVVFSHNELTEKIQIKPLKRNGEEGLLPVAYHLDHEPWVVFDYDKATISASCLNYAFLREGCEILATGYAIANYMEAGDIQTFLSNKLSDNYHLIFQYFLTDKEGEIQISTTDISRLESRIVNNYIDNFVKYDIPQFCNTPLHYEFGSEHSNSDIQGLLWINNVQQGSAGVKTEKSDPDIYISTQSSKSFDIKTSVMASNIQATKTITWEEDYGDGKIHEFSQTIYAGITGLPTFFNGSTWEYVNTGRSPYQWQGRPTIEYPGLEAYCYFSDQITEPIGNSSPILALATITNQYLDNKIFAFIPTSYIGRYGEIRDCDQWRLHVNINLNGETVFEDNCGENISNWCIENSTDNHEKGIIEATFTNRNVLVDETIPGFNITSIKVDERNDDLCAPTTQMLIFKDTSGAVTDRFNKPENGIIEFSAGDFNWIDDRGRYDCEEAEVKVEYAPYCEETFAPLEVMVIPENYFMPGFGYFYRGSLEDVTMPSSNGWYDIRFTLKDKAGNQMVQHISPAFKIDSNVNVAATTVNGLKVWQANGNVFAAGDDIASIELFSPDGKRIACANASSVSTKGYHGIAIVRVTSSDGKATTLKTAI